ncbi:MAG: chromosome partitioning protein [Spirochaetaceae bacterium]|jgi:phage shock protein A|nr:chromosome partitioning protein [Spirochaetaceae bacterium]
MESSLESTLKEDNLTGMSVPEAKEYIAHYLTSLKLMEKKDLALEEELEKWTSRSRLARSQGDEALIRRTEQEIEGLKTQRSQLTGEIKELKVCIENMKKQLPLLGARERTIDPDLLEQNLIMAAGYLPGEEEKAGVNRRLQELEKTSGVDAELEVLKKKMGLVKPQGANPQTPDA